ncbi:hypothetical protein IC216_14265 [Clostridioides sp. ES-S-0145-01]|uniref:hypothetical protein n=1 Tax=Clostridioides sp. ES-S-0145-01 TaxID=2770784 RepID=UPI001D11CB70|nr:hypothetical protein [Clostridioides sp. ES-S-0145-01]
MKSASNKIKNNPIKKSKSFASDISYSEEDEYDPNAGCDETISSTAVNSFNFGTNKWSCSTRNVLPPFLYIEIEYF